MANAQTVQGEWDQVKGAVREKWGQLTDNDLQQAKGNIQQLVGIIEKKTGEARSQVEAFLNEAASGSQSLAATYSRAIKDGTAQASEVAQEQYEQIATQVKAGYQEAEAVVRDRPAESVAVAFGAGLIAGIVTGLILRSR